MSSPAAGREVRVVDTNVLVYIVGQHPLAAAYAPHLDGIVGVVSFVTLGELLCWPIQEGWRAARVAALEASLAAFQRHSEPRSPDFPVGSGVDHGPLWCHY